MDDLWVQGRASGLSGECTFDRRCCGASRFPSQLAHYMLHQPLGGARGQASDIEIQAREILSLKKRLYEILSQHSGKDLETIAKDADRDYWLSAEEARDYGLIDNLLEPQEVPAAEGE